VSSASYVKVNDTTGIECECGSVKLEPDAKQDHSTITRKPQDAKVAGVKLEPHEGINLEL
jgi:O-glycosyl hydrolase